MRITERDAGNLTFRRVPVRLSANGRLELAPPPHGGFVFVLE